MGMVETGKHPPLPRDDLEQAISYSGRVEVEHPDPRNRSLGHERLEQFREVVAIAAVASLVREILRPEVELARALQVQPLRFTNDFVDDEGAMFSPHQRNSAKGTTEIPAPAD